MRNAHLTRQHDLIPENILDSRINVIGVGAIGSFVVLQLAKMGFSNIHVWDNDSVSEVNMSCQFYRFQDIHQPKVEALSRIVWDFAKVKFTANPFRYEGEALPGIIITAVDSMSVRKSVWEIHKGKSLTTRWIIDPRMSALNAALYTARPMNRTDWDYEKSLHSDADSVEERCTAKSTMFTVNLISGLVVKTVVDCLTNKDPLKMAQWSISGNDLVVHKRNNPDSDPSNELFRDGPEVRVPHSQPI